MFFVLSFSVLNCPSLFYAGPNCISPFKAQESELGDLSTKLLLHYSPKVIGHCGFSNPLSKLYHQPHTVWRSVAMILGVVSVH